MLKKSIFDYIWFPEQETFEKMSCEIWNQMA